MEFTTSYCPNPQCTHYGQRGFGAHLVYRGADRGIPRLLSEYAADVGVQIIRRSPRHIGRERTHAYDQETAAGGRGERGGPHCGRTVLRPGCLISSIDKGHSPFTTS